MHAGRDGAPGLPARSEFASSFLSSFVWPLGSVWDCFEVVEVWSGLWSLDVDVCWGFWLAVGFSWVA